MTRKLKGLFDFSWSGKRGKYSYSLNATKFPGLMKSWKVELFFNSQLGCLLTLRDKKLIQWNSVNKSTSEQPVLDLIRGGFNKRRFLKCTRRFRSKQIGCNKRLDLLTVDLLTEFHCIHKIRLCALV